MSVIFGSLLLGTVAIYFLRVRLDDRVKRINQYHALIQDRADDVRTLAELKKVAPIAASYQKAIDLLLPTRDQLFDFPAWLDSIARSEKVVLGFGFQGDASAPQGVAAGQVPFSLNLTGGLDTIAHFLKILESPQATRFMIGLDSIDITKTGDAYKASAQGKTYFKSD